MFQIGINLKIKRIREKVPYILTKVMNLAKGMSILYFRVMTLMILQKCFRVVDILVLFVLKFKT